MVEGVQRLSGGSVDAIIANAGGGPPETSLSLNFFGAVATLEGLRPLLESSAAPRAVAVSSIASLRPSYTPVVEACLMSDERAAVALARSMFAEGGPIRTGPNPLPDNAQAPLDLYGNAKYALQRWCRKAAGTPQWAGAGIPLNVVALGFLTRLQQHMSCQTPTVERRVGAWCRCAGHIPAAPRRPPPSSRGVLARRIRK